MASRRFSERQVADIVRKAAEIQARGANSSTHEGVSEQELRAAARELGIEGPAIDEALKFADLPEARENVNFFGGPFRHEREVVFDGSVSDDQWEEVVADLRKTFGEAGKIEQRGSTYEWSGTGGGVDYNTVTLRQANGTVRVKVSSKFAGRATTSYPVALVPLTLAFAIGLLNFNLGSPLVLALFGTLTVLLFLVARAFAANFVDRRRASIAGLTDRMQTLLESSDSGVRSHLSGTRHLAEQDPKVTIESPL